MKKVIILILTVFTFTLLSAEDSKKEYQNVSMGINYGASQLNKDGDDMLTVGFELGYEDAINQNIALNYRLSFNSLDFDRGSLSSTTFRFGASKSKHWKYFGVSSTAFLDAHIIRSTKEDTQYVPGVSVELGVHLFAFSFFSVDITCGGAWDYYDGGNLSFHIGQSLTVHF